MASLDERLAALETLAPAQLQEIWQTLFKTKPPRLPADMLRLGIAYRWQEMAAGKRRGRPLPALRSRRRSAPGIGTQFLRTWNGRTIAVTLHDDGYHWEDRRYASLSAIAREVTGAHWSGPRFFGVSTRG